ncbi:MAG: recombinase family protein [Pirellulales bacterium]
MRKSNAQNMKAKDAVTRKCGLYGRVSTLRQAMVDDGGLDTQFSRMEKTVDFENEKAIGETWEIVDRYREEGRSGKDLERPEFKRLMADVQSGRINTVVVYKIDRITRSLRDFITLWETFEQYDVQFVSLHEKFDTTTAVGRAMLKLILIFAELEREQTAERTAATMQHRAEQGLWNGGVRLGYDLDPNNKGVLKVNPDEKVIVVNDFFKKCLELGSAGKVVQHLAKQGIRRKQYTNRNGKVVGGGPYYKQPVMNVLTDKVYLGMIVHNGQAYPGQHEAIVEEDLFMQVQDLIRRNSETRTNALAQEEHVFLLQGLARCGKCGSFMTPKWSSGRGGVRNFYYCCTRQSHSMGTECTTPYVPAGTIENFVVEQISAWAKDRDEIERAVQAACKFREIEVTNLTQELSAIRARLRETQAGLSQLVTAIQSGKSFRAVEERMEALEQDRTALEERINRLELERSSKEQETLSSDVIAETYCDFPFIVSRLREDGNLHGLKDLLACYIAAIDIHQEAEDPSSGHMNIMLFEEELPGWKPHLTQLNGAQEKTLTFQPLTGWNCERVERLPR